MVKGRVLVVDDEPMFGDFVRTVCEELGHEVLVTIEARAFQDAYESFDPTVVILDVIMPDVDGIELLQWLIDQGCSARILVVTGYNPKYAEMAQILGGAKGLDVRNFSKPVRAADLRTALS